MKITVKNIKKATNSKTADEAAAKIKCSRQALYNWEKEGFIGEKTTKGLNIANWHTNLKKLGLSPTLEAI